MPGPFYLMQLSQLLRCRFYDQALDMIYKKHKVTYELQAVQETIAFSKLQREQITFPLLLLPLHLLQEALHLPAPHRCLRHLPCQSLQRLW